MTTDEVIRNSIKAGAPGLSDLIVGAIVRSAMMKICHHAGVELSEENDRLMDELRQRNCDLSYMTGERDILLKAVQNVAEYDDGTKLIINGECGGMARKAVEEWQACVDRHKKITASAHTE